MHHFNPNTDKSLPLVNDPELAALLHSHPPSSPAPAYTALPDRNDDFYLAPILSGRVGDVELETVDGKRFLVHKKVLEVETVFFHIYYGFIPVWRLSSPSVGPPHPHLPSGLPPAFSATPTQPGNSTLNNLFCLPKFLASHLRPTPSSPADETPSSSPPPALSPAADANANLCTGISPCQAPRPPPKDVTAPTPTTSPYTWAVPETSFVLTAFLSLIYPAGTFTPSPTAPLTSLDLTGRVIRAALGYQSAKTLNAARDHLGTFIDAQPVETYAMACYFKFTDLARFASVKAMGVPRDAWAPDSRILMGRSGSKALERLHIGRLAGLRAILDKEAWTDEHSAGCVRTGLMKDIWDKKTRQVSQDLRADSDLLELLEVDLRGDQCGDCLVLLGQTIQSCLYEARDLPRSI